MGKLTHHTRIMNNNTIPRPYRIACGLSGLLLIAYLLSRISHAGPVAGWLAKHLGISLGVVVAFVCAILVCYALYATVVSCWKWCFNANPDPFCRMWLDTYAACG